ncbi:MAG: hypothetical protein KF819_08820 [Labilithrix sp.]|nr:hypothetical protein [Labilithrix sp.]
MRVEDDTDTREVLAAALGAYGANVSSARDAESVMRILARSTPEVIVSEPESAIAVMPRPELVLAVLRLHLRACPLVAASATARSPRARSRRG